MISCSGPCRADVKKLWIRVALTEENGIMRRNDCQNTWLAQPQRVIPAHIDIFGEIHLNYYDLSSAWLIFTTKG